MNNQQSRMKRQTMAQTLLSLLMLVSLWSITSPESCAQATTPPKVITSSPDTPHRGSIIEFLESPKIGQGSIRIFQSPAIRTLVKLRPNSLNTSDITGGYSVLSGFKVQVYSGNASNSKAIAQQRSAMVQGMFPDLETELQYKAPFWRVRAGNFITQVEANEYLNVLKKEFPRYGKEMYVVRATIKIPR